MQNPNHRRLRLTLLFGAILVALASPASALSPEAASFLVSIGIDPSSEEVKIADADGEIHTMVHGDPEVFSLENLAIAKRANGVRRFIFTRSLIRRLKADYAAFSFTDGGDADYNGDYLTPEDRLIVVDKMFGG